MISGPRSPLPPFTADGVLPPEDYLLTLDDLMHSHLITGDASGSTTWDAPWRTRLVQNLGTVVQQLWQVGITEIFVNGSFVEAKDHPHDEEHTHT